MRDVFQRIQDDQEVFRRLAEPVYELRKHIEANTAVVRAAGIDEGMGGLLAEIEQIRRLADTSIVDGLDRRHFAAAAASNAIPPAIIEQMEAHRKLLERVDARIHQSIAAARGELDDLRGTFRLPPAAELGRLATHLLDHDPVRSTALGALSHDATLAAMQAMRSPWLDADQEMLSARGFSGLIAMGRGIADLPPFERDWTASLRTRLGDWRDPIAQTEGWCDHAVRQTLYQERGFDPALVHFPSKAFADAVNLAGLRQRPATASGEPDGEDAAARSVRAFGRLLDLERALRIFIAATMKAEFGDDWMRRQLPNNMLEAWREKRMRAVAAGQPECPLIEYADFTNYRAIIEREDNWLRVFKRVFGRVEDVRESLQRVSPLRVATMHARTLAADDEVLLFTESGRLMKAIRKARDNG